MASSPNFRGVALVVDDEQCICDIVASVLREEGFTVVTANSGEEALVQLEAQIFDIVFTDVCMDGISGLDLLDRISSLDETIKTIIMTGHGGYDTVLQALQGGAYDYIEKPLPDHAELASVARKAHLHALLQRDNNELIAELKDSHSKLARANAHLIELNKKLESLALSDPLTGLRNRRFIEDALRQEVALYKRYENPFSLMLIDVDHFKEINDSYGHTRGDELLQHLADVFLQNSRSSDTVGRFGGEEFFILLYGTTAEGAETVANRIRHQVSQPVDLSGDLVSITVSIGIAELDGVEKLSNPSELVRRSDEALYVAKNKGRNRVEVYRPNAYDQPMPDLRAAG